MTNELSMSQFASKEDYWKARCEAAERDAERYRWLRERQYFSAPYNETLYLVHDTHDGGPTPLGYDWRGALDAAIDAALAAERKEGKQHV